MYFQQFYLGCLAHASYFIGSEGEAVVVDPRRDIEIYVDEAREQGFQIKYVIETHLHADFVSGHRELAARTGARVVFGAAAPAKFDFMPAHDGDEIPIGKVTPGSSRLRGTRRSPSAFWSSTMRNPRLFLMGFLRETCSSLAMWDARIFSARACRRRIWQECCMTLFTTSSSS